ncbi:hypothetical protein B0X71_09530 [Planococcus lenghuensis]|uniref:Uncharacterized protein n=1 Tax=Planococcus lenghuensis TaxID=2213202 RepID=A0A1Q2KYJ6_9BACL|nr:hypothetical protein B0X71_09530 [Planococcus lenghuensis]
MDQMNVFQVSSAYEWVPVFYWRKNEQNQRKITTVNGGKRVGTIQATEAAMVDAIDRRYKQTPVKR